MAVEERRFRADLQARLDGLTVVLPPLRDRREDIAPLFLELVRARAAAWSPAIDAKLIEALCLYDWPLNVRELVSLARRLVSLHAHEPTLQRANLPERMRAPPGDGSRAAEADAPRSARRPTDDEMEFEAFIEALRRQSGSVARAADAMGISRARAYRLLHARPDFSLEALRRSDGG